MVQIIYVCPVQIEEEKDCYRQQNYMQLIIKKILLFSLYSHYKLFKKIDKIWCKLSEEYGYFIASP